jgi:hypothetical protein
MLFMSWTSNVLFSIGLASMHCGYHLDTGLSAGRQRTRSGSLNQDLSSITYSYLLMILQYSKEKFMVNAEILKSRRQLKSSRVNL